MSAWWGRSGGVVRAIVVGAALAWAWSAGAGPGRAGDKPKEKAPRLEFRILANEKDDGKALEAARKYLAGARDDAGRLAELRKRATAGLPPPPPEVTTDKAPGYSWVEVGPAQLRVLKLDNASAADERRNLLWKVAARARAGGQAIVLTGPLQACLLYSRVCENSKRSEEERGKKKYEYFLLTRDPEKGKAITGAALVAAKAGLSDANNRSILFELNKKGGDLFFDLTSKNSPDGPGARFRRYLAIVVDGAVVSAPAIVGALREKGQITGRFTRQEADRIIEALRSDLPGKK